MIQVSVPVENHLLAIHFAADGTGWVGGASGVLLRLDDGRWLPYQSPSEKSLYTISTDAAGNLWVAGKGGKLYTRPASPVATTARRSH